MKIIVLKTREVPGVGLLNEGEERDLPDKMAESLKEQGIVKLKPVKATKEKKED